MRGHWGGIGVAVAGLVLSGCASQQEREWDVAADPRATPDEIIDAGHAVDVATSRQQMVVTWQVEPEDDEGPYQGAWRLYDQAAGRVADGAFGTVHEASGRIDVVAVRDGFLLTDYKKHGLHFLDEKGKVSPAYLPEAKRGTSLADGVLIQSESPGPQTWQAILPEQRQIVPLTDLPTEDVQGIELTADGTVWVLLPWKDGGPFRIAHAKDGVAPWTTETIPSPKGSGIDGQSLSASGGRLFVVASHMKGDRSPVDAVLSRESGPNGRWETIDATGIADNLTVAPRITVLPEGRLVATSSGEGDWIQRDSGDGWEPLHPPKTHKYSRPSVSVEGRWLWAAEAPFGKTLHYSFDDGTTWREFER